MRFYPVLLPTILAVVALPGFAQIPLNPTPTQVIGQDSLTISSVTPNLVEGRELDSPLGVALDLSVNPPHVYVADTGNNRVLGWANAVSFSNGQKADIVIGQPDLVTTFAQGPNRGGTPRTTGLATPVGLVVDANGNLYIDDCGNNRVLRFPKPFSQTSIFPDMVIGQTDFTGNSANGGASAPTAATLELSTSNGAFTAYLTFDGSGNLWVADPGDNRVLRFNASALSAGASGPSADLVIGQADFVSNSLTGYTQSSLTQINTPTGVAFDSSGNFFVSESVSNQFGRVLVFTPPTQNGQAATRLIGELTAAPATPVNASQIGPGEGSLIVFNNQLMVADSNNNRLLVYPAVSQWSTDLNTQPAASAVGQPNLTVGSINQGLPQATAATLASPFSMAFSGTELYVADSLNHRVVVLPLNGSAFGPATRVIGQDALTLNTVNLIEGREFRFTSSIFGGGEADGGIVIDPTSTPPHLYVSDTYNNRVLGYNDVHAVHQGSVADIVIGQPDFLHSEINYPSNVAGTPNQSGLFSPVGLAVDIHGNLYVADAGNGRILRFPQPFAKPQNLPTADIVLGQSGFTVKITDPSISTMHSPYGLAFAADLGLFASDSTHNRVLYFAGPSSGFATGMSAAAVLGQPNFNTITAGSTNDKLNAPHHVSTDAQSRLYVADSGNSRVSIFDAAPSAGPDPQAAITIPHLSPIGLFVNQSTGELWVGDDSGNAYHFPSYDTLALGNLQSDSLSIGEAAPVIALFEDSGSALYVADATNRVVIHYPGIAALNAANYIVNRPLAPSTIASIYSLANQVNYFSTISMSFNQLPNPLPIPTTLADTQITVNGVLSPIYFVGPEQINFMVPNSAPTSGTAVLQVVRASTGQILGSAIVPMATAAPGLFTSTANGSGQVAAVNQDFTINGPSHPAPWNSIVSFYGTGTGMISGAPPDGTPASTATPTSSVPQVFIGSAFVPAGNVTYSGLAPGEVGVWQVNVKIPNTVPPTTASAPTPVIILLDSIPSGGPSFGRSVTMWVSNN